MSVLPDQQGQIECSKCKKSFRGNLMAERIRCPHCHHVNLLNVKPLPNWVKPEVPKLSLADTRGLVDVSTRTWCLVPSLTIQGILQEDVTGPGWEPVQTSYEHINSLNGRWYCVGDNGNEVWVGVAESVEIPGKIEEVGYCEGIDWRLRFYLSS